MFLSIVIPVYKVEEYIGQCIDSLVNHNIPPSEFEIIAIDDGSPDNSGYILDQYAKKCSNLKVIHKQNQGLSEARNTGLDEAQGEYVWFVDSDDWIQPGALVDIKNSLCNHPDILEIGFNYVWPNKTVSIANSYQWDGLISGCEAYLRNGIAVPAQFTIVRRSLLIKNNLRFYPGILHEDTEYKPKLVILANTAACLGKPIYNYRQRMSGNIMSSYGWRNARDLITGCYSLVRFIRQRMYQKKEYMVIGNAIGSNINHILYRLAHYDGKDVNMIIKLLKENRELFQWMRYGNKLKYQVESLLFRLNFKKTFYLLQFIQRHK